MYAPLSGMQNDDNLSLKHAVITKSTEDIKNVRDEEQKIHDLKVNLHKRKSLQTASVDIQPQAFKQHPNSQNSSPILMTDNQVISTTTVPRLAVQGMTTVSSEGGITPLGGTPRHDGQPGQLRNFVGDDRMSQETNFFRTESFKKALADFADSENKHVCTELKKVLEDHRKNRPSKKLPYIFCAGMCVGLTLVVTLEMALIGLLAAVLARQK